MEHHASVTAPTTARLLICGVVAGPLFLALWSVQAVTRDGYDLTRHPLSLLSLGDPGWIQITNFMLCGALLLASAAGLGRELRSGRGHRWAPVLVGLNGVGLIMAGIFPTDAGAGFPSGAPAGAPEMSWHGMLHEVGFLIVQIAWFGACLVFARRFSALGHKKWMRLCAAAPAAAFLVLAIPHMDSLSVRMVLATAIQLGLLAVLARHHIRT
ncbi:hypothetical protein GCM10010156_01010 [Planobispora rosea]|uniref:DUF998 domain-containing protein n=1 Tax=Planobispora rosea TaxID=35762 RepID=A0A8J3WAS2_PLARO|nr:DUF998 domain-containing protein [Planobispora rosea]GGS46134.1 hypothetical protein GCM10010156_01010 [Planobispora rosea]GIH82385.1 hypothetical protein Pro02_07930 [Planobispora rosea]